MPDFTLASNELFLAALDEKSVNKMLQMASQLRAQGIKTVTALEPVKLKKAFPMAEKRGAKFVAFIGESEIQNNTMPIKNLKEKTQVDISMNDISEITKHLRA